MKCSGRKPDSALVWYETSRDDTPLPDSYWMTLSGEWSVWRGKLHHREPAIFLAGRLRKLAWKYDGFSDLHIRARVGFPQNGGGRAGVFLGTPVLLLKLRYSAGGAIPRLHAFGELLQQLSKTPDAQLHSDPTVYTIEMRKRGSKVRVYSGSATPCGLPQR